MIPYTDFTPSVWALEQMSAGFKENINLKSSGGKDPEQSVLVIRLSLLRAEYWAAGLQRSLPS